MPQDDFQSPKAISRFILREALFGSLATGGDGGYPFVALVGVAAMPTGAPVMLLPNLARVTFNIRKDPRVSLLISEKPKTEDLLQATRLTLTGKAATVEKNQVRVRYLLRHPEAARYVDHVDFGFWSLAIERGHFIMPSGKTADLTAEELLGQGAISWPGTR